VLHSTTLLSGKRSLPEGMSVLVYHIQHKILTTFSHTAYLCRETSSVACRSTGKVAREIQ